MSARRLALLGLAAVLCLAPLASAGTRVNPETGDDANDDVDVAGSCSAPVAVPPASGPCNVWQPDFIWANIDIDWAWVNDTLTDLVFTGEMKGSPSYSPDAGAGGPFTENDGFTYTYTFAFTVDGVPFAAIAAMGPDGVFQLGGVAATFLVHDANQLTVTVPKDVVGANANGAVVGSLVYTAHGEDENGLTMDDRAPDAEGGRDYAVANSTGAPPPPPAANTTGNATSGSQGPALTGTSTGPTRPPVSGTAEPTYRVSYTSPNGAVDDEEKDTPGLPVFMGALAIVVVGAFIRRRL
jgi:hypothetical protein